jgi:hypothetical protein
MLVLGVEPNQVDVLNFLDGCEFDAGWNDRKEGILAEETVSYVSLEDYVRTKRSCDRPKDRHDLDRLKEVLGSLPEVG